MPTATPSPTPEPPFPWTAFGPGTWRVGEQILPGVYEAANVSGQCEWASLSRLDDAGENVAFSGTTAAPVSVSILPTDAGFRASEGCGHWTAWVPPTPTPTFTPTPFPPLPPLPLHGFDAEAYFSGKAVAITVGVSPGNGLDAFARVFRTHLERELPGNPRVDVHNAPGAAVSSAASVTGLNIVVVESTLIQQSTLGRVSEFDAATDLSYLGAIDMGGFTPSDQTWCIRTDLLDDPNNALEEFFAGSFTLGQFGREDAYTEWAVQVGFPFESAFVSTSARDMHSAFGEGTIAITPICHMEWELDRLERATPLFYARVEPDWVKAGKAEGKYQWVDSIRNIAEQRLNASPAYLDALDALLDSGSPNLILAMSSQTPEAIISAMRAAFLQIAQSVIADMRLLGYDDIGGLRSGDQYQAQVEALASLPEETLALARGLFPD